MNQRITSESTSKADQLASREERRKFLLSVLESKLVSVVAAFALTGIVGHYLTARHQKLEWERNRRVELFSQRLAEARQVVDDVTLRARERFIAMQKVLWKLESRDMEAARVLWSEYESVKDEWNTRVYIDRNKLERLLNRPLALLLIGATNGNSLEEDSVHSRFVKAHKSLRELLRSSGTTDNWQGMYSEAQADLGSASSAVDALTELIFRTYLSDEGEFDTALSSGSSRGQS